MPPILAASLCFAFIIISIIIDLKRRPHVSMALWVPWIWVMITASRPVTLWLYPEVATATIDMSVYEEGTPIDRAILATLIVAGLFILNKRLNWSEMFRSNIWILLFFLYCGISILWSDIGFVALKRWIKVIGALIMVLVILTEDDPAEAIKTLIIRCAYILIPLSILFIKYYPDFGVGYSPWGGKGLLTGVTTNKNNLGRLCLICGLILFWHGVTLWHSKNISEDKKQTALNTLFLIMTTWLLIQSNSMTSLSSFVVAVCVFICLGLPLFRRNLNHIGIFILLIFSSAAILFLLTDFDKHAVESMGRDLTFTGRTELWKNILSMHTNVFIGVGFDSFWSGERLLKLWDLYWWKPNESHNGYLEVYLELGIIGISLLLALIVHTYRKIRRKLADEFDYGRFQAAFLIAFLLYNVTEAAVKGINIVWFFFLVIAVDIPSKPKRAASEVDGA
jgi:exopolysaccharide production protein ExoQ